MSAVRIEFDPDAFDAILAAEQPGKHWDVVKRALRDASGIYQASALQIKLPWSEFISRRRALAYQIGVHELQIEFGPSAKTELERLRYRDELLSTATSVAECSDAEIHQRLAQAGFVRPLLDFQIRNLRRLCRLPVGADFSVPGSGKTTVALAFYCFHKRSDSRLLVVAPKNAFAAWEEQYERCIADGKKFVRLRHGRRKILSVLRENAPLLMLITYEQLPAVADALASYMSKFSSFMFLDESHRIKGGQEKIRASAALGISPAIDFKLVLSGTPLPNSPSDLLPQAQFIAPEIQLTDENAIEVIKPFFVRTTKLDLGLPPPKRVLVPLPMGEEQRKLYELLRSQIARDAQVEMRHDIQRAFRQINRSAVRLLQYVSNPALLVGKISNFDDYLGRVIEEGDSPKMNWACLRARQIARQNKKVIIWSSFVENVEILAERLEDLGASYIHGGVDASSDAESDGREARIARFHDDPSAKVLVANPAACGEGISLHTVCDHAIYLDRNYNAAQYLQSEDRIHRIGSDAQKFVEIVVCEDSIDLSVNNRLGLKIARMAEALEDPELRVVPISIDADQINLDDDDILDLLRHVGQAERAVA